jgi:hypothetical protein
MVIIRDTSSLATGGQSARSRAIDISHSTLHTWKTKLKVNCEWRPSRTADAFPQRNFPKWIIILDEANWRAIVASFLAWAKTEIESVKCLIDNDKKRGATVIAAIDAVWNKLPRRIIRKCKTE